MNVLGDLNETDHEEESADDIEGDEKQGKLQD